MDFTPYPAGTIVRSRLNADIVWVKTATSYYNPARVLHHIDRWVWLWRDATTPQKPMPSDPDPAAPPRPFDWQVSVSEGLVPFDLHGNLLRDVPWDDDERTVGDAQALATAVHARQLDKAGRPYIDHPAAVAAALVLHGPHAVMVGWLHDAVEDSALTLDDLAERWRYPAPVVSGVDAVTRRPDEQYPAAVARAARDELGRLAKLADNAHNSDPARLALLEPETRARLAGKYALARRILNGETGA